MNMHLETPLRHPDINSRPLMTKRARWLLTLGFLLPGSTQLLAGSKRLGRIGISFTLALLAAAILTSCGLLFYRTQTLELFTNTFFLLAIQTLLAVYALLWLILGVSTLKLMRVTRIHAPWRLPLIILSLLLTITPTSLAAWGAVTVDAGRQVLGELFRGAPPVAPVAGRYNFLLLGTDAGADREGLRPDSVSVISVNAQTGQAAIIGVPRELAKTPFPVNSPMAQQHPHGFGAAPNAYGPDGGCEVGRCILNGIYAEVELFQPELYPNAVKQNSSPGIEATRDAVSGTTGLQIQFVVLLNMDAFEQLIDALGGVTVNVPERLPIGGDAAGNNVEDYIEPGKQHLNGYQAEWFARSRYGSALGDYARMERQRQLQKAILAQTQPANVLLRFQDLAKAGTALVQTDIPNSMLGRFAELAVKAKNHEPVSVELVPPAIEPENPDYELVHALVAEGIAKASPPEKQ